MLCWVGQLGCSSRIAMCTPCMATDFLYLQLDGHVIDIAIDQSLMIMVTESIAVATTKI